MIKQLFNRALLTMADRYDYDVTYMQDILHADFMAFLKYMGFQCMSTHRGTLSPECLYAARLRAILREDCGPCAQLMVNMALEEGVDPDVVCALVDNSFGTLSDEPALVARFTELVLDRDPEADTLREDIVSLWGSKGLTAIAFSISASRVYPALKYTLGYGKACYNIEINNVSLKPG
ncbi:hypothetical protein [Pseudoteredinibacter isoporae]|uniref:hypothetical protein n=1 Tax=Pseudoteredinibacter isoporae TaxID=570281 RepID=UPI00310A157F